MMLFSYLDIPFDLILPCVPFPSISLLNFCVKYKRIGTVSLFPDYTIYNLDHLWYFEIHFPVDCQPYVCMFVYIYIHMPDKF